MKYILYNPQANNNRGEEKARELMLRFSSECKLQDTTKLTGYKKYIEYLDAEDEVVIVGGDGTLNMLANELKGASVPPKMYFCAAGTGNDFKRDVDFQVQDDLIEINDYIKNLPTVTANDTKKQFINGVGFGLDGMCCQIGDDKRKKSTKPINYAMIAVRLCLFGFKPKNATITVDGVSKQFKNVWIAPTMKGRFYGGGMMVAPNQDRQNEEGTVSTVILHCRSRLKTLLIFPKLFSGKHIQYTKQVEVLCGKEISVEFNEPTALQIDGDTVRNIKMYKVSAKS